MNKFSFASPAVAGEAIEIVASEPGSMYVAGGTNLLDLWKYNITQPDLLVDINKLDNHHAIERLPDGGLRLGALATNAATAYHPMIEERYPLLSKTILAGASPQIRNMATNGGNLLQRTRCYYFYDVNTPCNKREPGTGCSAIGGYNRIMGILGTSDDCIATFPSDMCVALAALDARVNVSGPKGERTIPFADFHRLPGDHPEIDNDLRKGELITSIDLPPDNLTTHNSYLKIRDRNSYAFALVSVATAFELENGTIKDIRIALGGVAHKPWRVPEAEAALIGRQPDDESFALAAEIILRGAKPYTFNSFKIELAKRAIIRNGRMALNPSSQLPGARPSA
ncbi:MAG: xanthine dehydrogenase family protein subunit M [Chitinophagaceae bacterium]|nr:MAG: xanthine dehydrogenase family protein subunit M [Chitinophagaceae bacterium]